MGDNLKGYRAIKKALSQLFPNATGRQAQYLLVLAALISGIVGSHKTNLSAIAAKIPDGADHNKCESRHKQYSRWLQNEQVESQVYFAPFARLLLQSLRHSGLVLVLDGSVVGQGCMALLVNVV